MAEEGNMENIQSQKLQLIEMILQSDNAEMLSMVSDLLQSVQNEEEYQLSNAELSGVEKGLEDFNQGRVVPHDEAKKSVSRWM